MCHNFHKMISKSKLGVVTAFDKGYRIRNNNIISPFNGKINGFIHSRNGMKYLCFSVTTHLKDDQKVLAHMLVAYEKFGKLFLENEILVRHLDGDSQNNNFDNIVLGSHSDNMMDIAPEIRRKKAITAAKKLRRFTDSEVVQILKDRTEGATYKDLCEKYNTSKSTLSFFFNKASYIKLS